MQRRRAPFTLALAATPLSAVVLMAGACGSAERTSPLDATGSPAPVARAQAAGFSAAIPQGWTDRTNDQQAVEAVGASGGLQMLLIAPPTGAVNNEHIDVTTVAQPVPDDQLAAYLQSVAQNGATAVTTPQPFNLGGASGLFVTYNLAASASGTQPAVLKVQDMLINHGGQTYEIVLNTALANFDAQLQSLQSVLISWRWNG